MKMTTKLQKLGNSYAFIVPKGVVKKYGANAGDVFELKEEQNGILFRPSKKKELKYTLDELLKGISKKKYQKEIDWGKPVGNEFW